MQRAFPGRPLLWALLLSAHGTSFGKAAPPPVEALYTVQAGAGEAMVRALTRAAACPAIRWDGGAPQPMQPRATPATVPVRGGGAQKVVKDAVFDVLTCQAPWRAGAKRAQVAGQAVPAPHAQIQRIVVVGDTGCRMKASDGAYQACNDPATWPWPQVAQSAAALKPDLVIHVGDIHYRETPCDAARADCAGSPWGYGYDAWQADLFTPAKALLAAAPWVFVRGNHETCARAGQGWFRFVDPQAWRPERSCNDPALDDAANYSQPYAVPIAADTQLIVFDSSATSGKPFKPGDLAYIQYAQQLAQAGVLARQRPHNFFLSHHPLYAVAPLKAGKDGKEPKVKPGGNEGLQSVFAAQYPERLLPAGVDVAMHGHVHLFQAFSFKTDHPVSLVMGNSGSVNEGSAPDALPSELHIYKDAVVDNYRSRSEHGFAVLDRLDPKPDGDWLLTEYTASGQPVIRCVLSKGKSHCDMPVAAH